MSRRLEPSRIGRRTFLAGLGAAGGIALLGGVGSGATSDGPGIDWQRTYSGGDSVEELSSQGVVQTGDGGYALAGTAVPTGGTTKRLALVKTDATGARQWTTLVGDDDPETTDFSFGDLVTTSDGSYGVVGYVENPVDDADDQKAGKVAVAARFTGDGTLDWLSAIDAFEDDESSDLTDNGTDDNALLLTAAATDGGGVLAGGTFEGSAWLVAFDDAGNRQWDRQYEGFSVTNVRTRADGGIDAIVDRDGTYAALTLDATGAVQSTVTLSIPQSEVPYNHVFDWGLDGGYAYTGRDRNRESMVLGTLDAEGNSRWREEYDGPYGEDDWARTVVATRDGGYALGGYMRSDPEGSFLPTILRTDGEGVERWRRLFTGTDASKVTTIVGTADGGYACLLDASANTLVKLAPDESLDGGQGSPSVPQVDGVTPTDPDGDGRYEDVDGDGDGDLFDALTYYNERDSDAIQNNPAYFDFDGDGDSGDLFDALALYNDIK